SLKLRPGGARSSLQLLPLTIRDGRVDGIDEHDNAPAVGYDLLQQLETLASNFGNQGRRSCQVATGPCERSHESALDGVTTRHHHVRYRARRIPGGLGRSRSRGDDHVHFQVGEFVRQLAQAVRTVASRASLDCDLAILEIAASAQALPQSILKGLVVHGEEGDPTAPDERPCWTNWAVTTG